MIDTIADPALRGLEGRERGSACTTPCHPGCEVTCHERCRKPGAPHAHDQFYCDQIRIGRDVTEYRPEIRLRHAELARAARAFVQHDIPWVAALHIAEDNGFTAGDLSAAVVRADLRAGQRAERGRRAGSAHLGGHFGAQRMPWHRRLLARLRGWDA